MREGRTRSVRTTWTTSVRIAPSSNGQVTSPFCSLLWRHSSKTSTSLLSPHRGNSRRGDEKTRLFEESFRSNTIFDSTILQKEYPMSNSMLVDRESNEVRRIVGATHVARDNVMNVSSIHNRTAPVVRCRGLDTDISRDHTLSIHPRNNPTDSMLLEVTPHTNERRTSRNRVATESLQGGDTLGFNGTPTHLGVKVRVHPMFDTESLRVAPSHSVLLRVMHHNSKRLRLVN